MGKSYSVITSELENASKELQQYSETYTSIYKQLFEKAGTMGEAWVGDDNAAFVQQINGLCKRLQDMAAKIANASKVLHQQEQNYLNHESDNTNQVKKLGQ